jgi:hypothetical protein
MVQAAVDRQRPAESVDHLVDQLGKLVPNFALSVQAALA